MMTLVSRVWRMLGAEITRCLDLQVGRCIYRADEAGHAWRDTNVGDEHGWEVVGDWQSLLDNTGYIRKEAQYQC